MCVCVCVNLAGAQQECGNDPLVFFPLRGPSGSFHFSFPSSRTSKPSAKFGVWALLFENGRPPQKAILHYQGVDELSTKGGNTPLFGCRTLPVSSSISFWPRVPVTNSGAAPQDEHSLGTATWRFSMCQVAASESCLGGFPFWLVRSVGNEKWNDLWKPSN